MIKKKNKKGFALIWVILIGAIFFLSITGFLLRLVPQNQMTVARTNSQRTLASAEAALSQTAFDIRNVNFVDNNIQPTTMTHYLTPQKIKEVVENPVDHITDCSEIVYSTNPYTTYHVKIKRLNQGFTDTWNPDTGTDGDRDVYVDVYTLGTVYKDSSKTQAIARNAIKTEYKIVYTKNTETKDQNAAFNYALFSGADIAFGGGAQAVDGNIYAGGMVNLGSSPSKTRVKNGGLESVGGWIGSGKVDLTKTVVPDKGFPELNLDYYKALADDFKTGAVPYDGRTVALTNPDGSPVLNPDGTQVTYTYPDTTADITKAVIQGYLGGPGVSPTVDQIQTFYNDLMADPPTGGFLTINPTVLAGLKENARAIVYYIDGNATINAQFSVEGSIVVNGDLSINGGADIQNPGGLAFFVNGDIIRSNGNATLSGLFYATGGLKGNGTFSCTGSIVTKGPIDLQGTFDVTYVPITNMPNTDITGETIENSVKSANESSSTWQEITLDEFNSPS